MKTLLYITFALGCMMFTACGNNSSIGIIGGADGPSTEPLIATCSPFSDTVVLSEQCPGSEPLAQLEKASEGQSSTGLE